ADGGTQVRGQQDRPEQRPFGIEVVWRHTTAGRRSAVSGRATVGVVVGRVDSRRLGSGPVSLPGVGRFISGAHICTVSSGGSRSTTRPCTVIATPSDRGLRGRRR